MIIYGKCTTDLGTGLCGLPSGRLRHSTSRVRGTFIHTDSLTHPKPTEVEDFLNQTTKYMDELAWVERYAWFGYFVSAAASNVPMNKELIGLEFSRDLKTVLRTVSTRNLPSRSLLTKVRNRYDGC